MNFVVSYPKSGNTWSRLVAAAYKTDVDQKDLVRLKEGNITALNLKDIDLHRFQSVSPVPITDIDFQTQVRLRPAAMLSLAKDVSLLDDREPVLVQSHHANANVNEIPLWHSQWVDCVINPVRDPREVCCSHAAHFGNTYMESAETLARQQASTGPGDSPDLQWFLSSWSTHVKSWLEEDNFPVHTVRYEDLKANPVGEFHKIFSFLDVYEPDVEAVEQAVSKTRFERLRKVEAEQGSPGTAPDQEQFFRSGQTDGWKEELPTEVARKIEEDHGEVMEALGYL